MGHDLLEDLVRHLQTPGVLPHDTHWSRFRRHPDAAPASGVVAAVRPFLEAWGVRYASERLAVRVCQALMDGGALLWVAQRRPEGLAFRNKPGEFWRVTRRPFLNPVSMVTPPLAGVVLNFHEEQTPSSPTDAAGGRCFAVLDPLGFVLISREVLDAFDVAERAGSPPPIYNDASFPALAFGICLSHFRVARDGAAIRLQHAHTRLADVTWRCPSELEARTWEAQMNLAAEQLNRMAPEYSFAAPHAPTTRRLPADPAKRHVVVLGGGYCGTRVALALQDTHNVTLIDMKSYFENTPSVLRCLVEPAYRKYIHREYRECLQRCSLRVEHVHSVSPDHVLLGRDRVAYDYLVVSTGSRYQGDIVKSDTCVSVGRHATFQDSHARLAKAKHVLVIGGGLVGVELAAEIVAKYGAADPSRGTPYSGTKRVTLVTSSSRLLQRNPGYLGAAAEGWLAARGVVVLKDAQVTESAPSETTADAAFTIRGADGSTRVIDGVDVDFLCTGITPNSDFLSQSAGFAQALDADGYVCVDDSLRVRGFTHVFAGGDVAATADQKLAQSACAHAAVIVKNIQALTDAAGAALEEHRPRQTPAICVSLGPHDGYLLPPVGGRWMMVGGRLAAMAKSFVEYQCMKALTPAG
eukprot:TRINITY_DN5424_c0_g1_i2.p1 TRINITY_DN5424_c0_g1~~TRINITY_DN5424_c0_g1_i2.p1  ORF type:complete len:637 (+),score=166.15 TRINITY_DN5424_c0_g1_i2:1714-3624(+)